MKNIFDFWKKDSWFILWKIKKKVLFYNSFSNLQANFLFAVKIAVKNNNEYTMI